MNDLDLVLVDKSDGSEIKLEDRLNNTEMVEAEADKGEYEVIVRGSNVPQGPQAGKQPYALVISVQ